MTACSRENIFAVAVVHWLLFVNTKGCVHIHLRVNTYILIYMVIELWWWPLLLYSMSTIRKHDFPLATLKRPSWTMMSFLLVMSLLLVILHYVGYDIFLFLLVSPYFCWLCPHYCWLGIYPYYCGLLLTNILSFHNSLSADQNTWGTLVLPFKWRPAGTNHNNIILPKVSLFAMHVLVLNSQSATK